MSHFQQHSKFYNLPIHLSEDEMKAPLSVVDDFFTDYKLNEIRELNDQTLHICLTCDSPPFDNGSERDRILDYRRKEERVLEAAYLLLQESTSKKSSALEGGAADRKGVSSLGLNLSELHNRILNIQVETSEILAAIASARAAAF